VSKFLLNPHKPKGAAHIMRGDDTACRMLSTGGIPGGGEGYKAFETAQGRRICHMCQNVTDKPVAEAVDEPLPDDLTGAEIRQLKLLAAPGASVSVGLTIHAMLRRRGFLVPRAGERRGKRYFITEAGLAAIPKERP